jgi:aminobenzoyl-glutamate utilization protein B
MTKVSNSDDKKRLAALIDAKEGTFTGVSDNIWGFAETRFNLPKSERLLTAVLEKEGFAVERGTAGMEHAFAASYGSGGPVIGILAEYDSLSNMSQECDAAEKRPLAEDGNGHGCGHNALGAGALAAAVGLKDLLAERPRSATIKLFGCPAEESGSGKAFMARGGAFGGTDAMFTWHPWTETRVWGSSSLANYQVCFHFKGISAHAAASPELGRSALDAAELMSVGVNYLREHIMQDARIHYAYIDAGGTSPNVVQPNASVLYFIRAPKSSQVGAIFERVVDIAKGAALMTGTSMEVEWDSACSEYIVNDVLGRLMHKNMSELGDLEYTPEERDYARRYASALPGGTAEKVAELIKRGFPGIDRKKAEAMASEPILGALFPYTMSDEPMKGSTDVGDASLIAPTAQALVTCYPSGTASHSWQWVASGKSSIAHKGLIYAAKTIAMTALDAIDDAEILERAKREHQERLNGEKYRCAIPESVTPR